MGRGVPPDVMVAAAAIILSAAAAGIVAGLGIHHYVWGRK